MSATREELFAFTAAYFHVAATNITEKTRFRRDLKADAFSFFRYLLAVEEAFDIFLIDVGAEDAVTVGELAEIVSAATAKDKGEKEPYGPLQ